MTTRSRLIPGVLAGTAAIALGSIGLPIFASSGGATAPPPAVDIEARALTAYLATDDYCPGLRWELVAAIGEVESGHGTFGGSALDDAGEATPWIFGPPLDGSNGTQRIEIGSWIDWWGLAGPFEQAVGPMQFRAPTFDAWAIDADGDGVANPHDIDDAAIAAARYLCGAGDEITDERDALLRYNNSSSYVDTVLAIADSYYKVSIVGADGWLCPVAGPVSFIDSWGAPRSGGRTHKGVDMFARYGIPTVAPVAGVVEFRANSIGGLSWHLWGDDGNYYYGTHLAAYGSIDGPIAAGTVIGYVGESGNAAGTGAHLHFEIHPGRSRGQSARPVNPTPTVSAACSAVRLGPGVSGPS